MRWLENALRKLMGPQSLRGTADPEIEDALPRGAVNFHTLAVAFLGEEGAAGLERRQAEGRRERDYAGKVRRMERVVKLRQRQLAAQAQFDKLR